MTDTLYRLTQYSHGAGCGCKLAPDVLSAILGHAPDNSLGQFSDRLLVGNTERDDAAAFALDDQRVILSTTDFFMPIVDDPFTFGRIAATNAISDIYAMGGRPLMAIAILAWPIDKLPADVAGEVIAGGRAVCQAAGIPLAGGHSIDAPEPIFGLAVTGEVSRLALKRNHTAKAGDILFLTKPLGIGILTTAEKRGVLSAIDQQMVIDTMCQLNTIGMTLAQESEVHAMTDVTGFGLGGHLLEMCEGSDLRADIATDALPILGNVEHYLDLGCLPGGCQRNETAYGQHITGEPSSSRTLLFDPQTSGGLLVSVAPEAANRVAQILGQAGLVSTPIGSLLPASDAHARITLRD